MQLSACSHTCWSTMPGRRGAIALVLTALSLLLSATPVVAYQAVGPPRGYDYDAAAYVYDAGDVDAPTVGLPGAADSGDRPVGWARPRSGDFGHVYDSVRSPSAPNRPIGFASGAADSALANVGRVDHASIHLIDEGLIAGSKGSTVARNGFRDAARPILENPLQTFDHVMARSGQPVKGFVGEINGQQVVIFVAKAPNGKIAAGDIVTSVVPGPQQAVNWGIN